MLKGLSTLICEVDDMDRAVSFYRDLLGFEVEMTHPEWSSLLVGGVKIGLHPRFENFAEGDSGGWILGIEVDDLPALKSALEWGGYKCGDYHDVPGGVVMDFRDPDGNRLNAMQTGITVAELA
jgi:predicted enzyme related to lactoylglutathione lyase